MAKYHFEGKTAVITGASGGIGKAIAMRLAREKANLVLSGRDVPKLKSVAGEAARMGVEAMVIPADVTQTEQIRAMIKQAMAHFGRIDILICNAGYYLRCPVAGLSIDALKMVMDINFYGAVSPLFEVLPIMQQQGSGHIVMISSVDGKKGLPPDGAYVASKFAMTGLCDVLRQELHGTGIDVSTIFPARVDTAMVADLNVPTVGPKMKPEKVANAVVRAINRRKAEVVVPRLGPGALLWLNFISPRLGDWAVRFFKLSGWEKTTF